MWRDTLLQIGGELFDERESSRRPLLEVALKIFSQGVTSFVNEAVVSKVSLSVTLCVSFLVSNVCAFLRWNPGSWRSELARQRSLR